MDLRRLRVGEWIVGVAGVALLVSLWLPWYEATVCVEGAGGCFTLTGWEAFDVLDIVIALVAITAIALLFVTAISPAPSPPLVIEALLLPIAGITAIVTFFEAASDRELFDPLVERWVGSTAVILIAIGCAVGMRDERLSRAGRPTDHTGRPSGPPPEIPTLPAPEP
jgi:hypothetical protein